jgi:glutamate racemase
MRDAAIGIFDSGVGGLSVFREVRALLPGEDLVYLADQANVPYGSRSLNEVRSFSEGAARFLLERGAKLVVVACNTASGAALHHLRALFPASPFVGMEPAVKPAAQESRNGAIGVLATPGTFQGTLFDRVVDRFARGVRVHAQTCPGLVEAVEEGLVDSPELRRLLAEHLEPLLRQEIDTLVLGCTHYPFALPAIRATVGPNVQVIDPAPAVARQVRRVLEEQGLLTLKEEGAVSYLTTGEPARFARCLELLLGQAAPVTPVSWAGGELTAKS